MKKSEAPSNRGKKPVGKSAVPLSAKGALRRDTGSSNSRGEKVMQTNLNLHIGESATSQDGNSQRIIDERFPTADDKDETVFEDFDKHFQNPGQTSLSSKFQNAIKTR